MGTPKAYKLKYLHKSRIEEEQGRYCAGMGWVVWLCSWWIPIILPLKAGDLWVEGRNGVTLYCTLHSAWALEVY